MGKPDEAGAASYDYLRLFGLVANAYMWAKMAELALPKVAAEEDDTGFYKAKLGTAKFFFDRMLPESGARLSAILAGGKSMMEFEDALF